MNRSAYAASAASLLFLAACGGGSNNNVTNNPPATTPPQVAAPTPTPPPFDPIPGASSCARFGPGKDGSCDRTSSSFMTDVDAVLNELMRERPALFENTDGGLRVVSTGQFYVAFLQKLDQRGICAQFDGEEVGMKNSDAFNDQFHMITSDQILRRGDSSYRATCVPASFPGAARGYPPNNGCSLPHSIEITCGREHSTHLAAVSAAIDKVVREHPEVFNLGGKQPAEGWYEIVNMAAYDNYVVENLKSAGYCSRHDGEELVVKNANAFSEHYDISTAEGNVRRGEGSYRSTCYPAAF
ncbi:MAG TPA: hypothetical protein VFQ51_13595 [Vicinamibacteria bacterium]|nr:hypothetical protein [Vicinamibacteria bacterium]